MSPPFAVSFQAAAARAPREAVDDSAKTLVVQILSLQTVSEPLALDAYGAEYERRGAEFFQTFNAGWIRCTSNFTQPLRAPHGLPGPQSSFRWKKPRASPS